MLLFKPEHVDPIRQGRKTQTRRSWKRARAKVGGIHRFYVQDPRSGAQPFARRRILNVRQERLGDISQEDAVREGYANRDAFLDAFCRINRTPRSAAVLDQIVWVVDFEPTDTTE